MLGDREEELLGYNEILAMDIPPPGIVFKDLPPIRVPVSKARNPRVRQSE